MRNESPLQAIRRKCKDCTCDQVKQIRACPVLECPLWIWRLGLHPYTKNNKENPFLCKKNFIGLENLSAEAVLEKMKEIE